MNFLQKLFHSHEYRWEKPNGDLLPIVINIPPNKRVKVIRVCKGCGDKLTQYWGVVDGEIAEKW